LSDPLAFYELDRAVYIERVYNENNNAVCIFTFKESEVYTTYNRSVYSYTLLLTAAGGLWSSLNLIGFGFTTLFSYNLMMSSLVAKLYNFKAKYPDELPKKKKNKDKKINKEVREQNYEGPNIKDDDEE